MTGKQTFRKPTSAETMSAILNEEPEAISQVVPGIPSGIAARGAPLSRKVSGTTLSVSL